jgi:hypothetical protein
MKEEKNYLKQLIIEVPIDVHMQIKLICVKRNIPMRTWILRQIIKGLREEI